VIRSYTVGGYCHAKRSNSAIAVEFKDLLLSFGNIAGRTDGKGGAMIN
jgi:hypothetical protein